MKRFIVFAAMMIGLCCGVFSAQAQTVTPLPTLPTISQVPGYATSGTLFHLNESITYRIDVPAGVDLVVNYSADKLVLVSYCVEIGGAPICPPGGSGGGDGDPPASDTIYIPSRERAQTIDFSIRRPIEGEAHYRLETFGADGAQLGLGNSSSVTESNANDPASAYVSYSLDLDPAQPFVIEIEDAQADGAFLWVAHKPFMNSFFTATNERQPFPRRIDAADAADNPKGITRLELYYLGGREFRVLIIAHGKFLLHSSSLTIEPLDPNTILPLTVSYRNPLGVVRLNNATGEGAKVDFQIAQGKRAIVGVYPEGDFVGDTLALGYDPNRRAAAPIAGTVEQAASDQPLYAVVQLGDGSTRAPVSVTMEWQVER